MASHSSILAWEIPWTEELDGRQSGATKLSHAEHTHVSTQQPTPVILTSSLVYFGVSYLLILVPRKNL